MVIKGLQLTSCPVGEKNKIIYINIIIVNVNECAYHDITLRDDLRVVKSASVNRKFMVSSDNYL